MTIRFRCPHCSQRLCADASREGQLVQCPKCSGEVPIPTAADESPLPPPAPPPPPPDWVPHASAPGAARPAEASPVPLPLVPPVLAGEPAVGELPRIIVHDDDSEWVYDTSVPAGAQAAGPPIDYTRISVPRRVVYMQGLLLAGLAAVGFGLGILFRGSYVEPPSTARVPTPGVLSGRVVVTDGGANRADTGSVILAVPADGRPPADGRGTSEGLRPSDPPAMHDHPNLRLIRGLGGDCARVDGDGRYRLQLSDRGTYFVLVISAHRTRPADAWVDKRDLAQLGRYFRSPLELLAGRDYRWQSVTLRGDQQLDFEL